jgi:predicted negative regulator of RcsB-dependent stress response
MAWNFYSNGNMPSTYMALAGVGLVIWGYFKNGTVYLAFQQLKKENYDKAEQLLAKISKPELLKKSQKSYYHFTKGFIELHKQNTDSAFADLNSALNLGLRTQNDTSIVTLNLSSIELDRKNLEEATNFLNQTKELNHKPELNSEIERIEAEINAAQQK